MPTPKRITPWLTLTTAQGNAVQIGGLLGACAPAWYVGREGSRGEAERGTRLMVAAGLWPSAGCAARSDLSGS